MRSEESDLMDVSKQFIIFYSPDVSEQSVLELRVETWCFSGKESSTDLGMA